MMILKLIYPIGIFIRFDGSGRFIKYDSVCPEVYGGLQTPKEPAEIIDRKVINRKGADINEKLH